MRHPHDHEQWEAKKKKNMAEREQRAEKRKADMAANGGKRQDQGKDKLALAKSFQSAFCSKFLVSEHEAQSLVDEVLAEHNGPDTTSDNAQSKD